LNRDETSCRTGAYSENLAESEGGEIWSRLSFVRAGVSAVATGNAAIREPVLNLFAADGGDRHGVGIGELAELQTEFPLGE